MADAKKRTFGVAVFGIGRAGTIHFTNIIQRPRLHLRYLIDLLPERGTQLLEKHFIPSERTQVCSSKDCQKVFDDENVDFVVVTTPTYEHEGIVQRALDAGKAVFCEKPVSCDLERTDQLFARAEERGVPLYCAFQRRFDPAMSKIREAVQNGSLGDVHMVTTFSRDSPLPSLEYLKISGGMFHDCGVHDIDMVCWVLGETPDCVFTRAAARTPEIKAIGDVDTVAIVLTFPSAAIATVHLSRLSTYHYDQRLEVHGARGMLSCGNPAADSVVRYDGDGANQTLAPFSFQQRYVVAYAAELDHFVSVLSGETERLLVTRQDVKLVSTVAAAAEKSYKTKQPVAVCL